MPTRCLCRWWFYRLSHAMERSFHPLRKSCRDFLCKCNFHYAVTSASHPPSSSACLRLVLRLVGSILALFRCVHPESVVSNLRKIIPFIYYAPPKAGFPSFPIVPVWGTVETLPDSLGCRQWKTYGDGDDKLVIMKATEAVVLARNGNADRSES